MEPYKKEFIEFMVDSGVLKFGEFTLKSGRKSPFFMNAGAYVTGAQARRILRESNSRKFWGRFRCAVRPGLQGHSPERGHDHRLQRALRQGDPLLLQPQGSEGSRRCRHSLGQQAQGWRPSCHP